ncbi:MAG: DUF115 domain-containing protein [Spirochaetales bacterium]|nr:DUF115 domain-containing protein [Spirochaetales bacterium]
MEKKPMRFWEANLALLRQSNPDLTELVRQLEQVGPWEGPWARSKTGENLPPAPGGRPGSSLVSVYDLKAEARRWIEDTQDSGGVVVLGGTSPYVFETLLKMEKTVFFVEPRNEVLRSLLTCWDWRGVFSSPSFVFPSSEEKLRQTLQARFFPMWNGKLLIKEWRSAVENEAATFVSWKRSLSQTIEEWTGDLSTQAGLGRRWLTQTLVNLSRIRPCRLDLGDWDHALVLGAGPGLEEALDDPKNKRLLDERPRNGVRVMASDTALPVLRQRGLVPDLIVCLDAQTASYQHFLSGVPAGVPLLADLAALPVLDRLTTAVLRFRSSHPLAAYASLDYPELPFLDTSLGQVAGVALLAAARLGARRASLWGLDFSYPLAKTYARGTYVYPYFQTRSSRLEPSDSLLSAFAWRTDLVQRFSSPRGTVYTNEVLLSYKKRLETYPWPLEVLPWAGPGLELKFSHPAPLPFQKETWENPDTRGRWPRFKERLLHLWSDLDFTSFRTFQEFETGLGPEQRQGWRALWPHAVWLKTKKKTLQQAGWKELAQESRRFALEILGKI